MEQKEKKKTFDSFSLSKKTKKSLSEMGFIWATEIQQKCIESGLKGKDLIATAKTGSGKTLAFVIPIIEILEKEGWNSFDGVGAIILSPSRNLAQQLFEVVKRIALKHDFVIGLLIGGTDPILEKGFLDKINILIATPGRLLYHMDKGTGLNTDNLQILVLDEADQILDKSFSETIDAILEGLPIKRQTLLFSATNTEFYEQRIALHSPEYIKTEEDETLLILHKHFHCKLEDKLLAVYAFLRKFFNKKTIFFLKTYKQVRFYHAFFKEIRSSVSVLSLHGKQSLSKRTKTCKEFSKKTSCALFSTDLAARGMDFSNVKNIVHVDCPENKNDYIHRIGRGCRFDGKGKSFLLLQENEISILNELEKSGIKSKKKEFSSLIKKVDLFKFKEKRINSFEKNKELSKMAESAVSSKGDFFETEK